MVVFMFRWLSNHVPRFRMLHTADTFTWSILSSGMLILSNCGRIPIAINSKPLYSTGVSALQGLSGLCTEHLSVNRKLTRLRCVFTQLFNRQTRKKLARCSTHNSQYNFSLTCHCLIWELKRTWLMSHNNNDYGGRAESITLAQPTKSRFYEFETRPFCTASIYEHNVYFFI